MTFGRWVRRAPVGAILFLFSLFFAIPLAWLLIASTKSTAQLNGVRGEQPFSFGSFAQLAENWDALVGFQNGIIWTWLGNSVMYTGLALLLTLIVTIPAGYALAMFTFRFRRLLLVATLLAMLIPFTALVLPIFLELSVVHLIGSPLAVILPFSFFPFGVYLAYIYFSTSISPDLLDAARIDGAGEIRVFGSIALPLATPVIALVGFFNVVANWNNYFLPFVMLPGSRTMPVQVGLADLVSGRLRHPELALATLVTIGPVLVLFVFSQRFLGRGSTAGATKE
jgi:multiple sugar transport system permease protein